MDQKKTGAFLQSLRKERELTQEELAEKFSVTSRTVSRWETGETIPDLEKCKLLAELFGVLYFFIVPSLYTHCYS